MEASEAAQDQGTANGTMQKQTLGNSKNEDHLEKDQVVNLEEDSEAEEKVEVALVMVEASVGLEEKILGKDVKVDSVEAVEKEEDLETETEMMEDHPALEVEVEVVGVETSLQENQVLGHGEEASLRTAEDHGEVASHQRPATAGEAVMTTVS